MRDVVVIRVQVGSEDEPVKPTLPAFDLDELMHYVEKNFTPNKPVYLTALRHKLQRLTGSPIDDDASRDSSTPVSS